MFMSGMVPQVSWNGQNNITRSAWFDGSADYLRRTPSSSGNLTNWTYSIWFRPIDLAKSIYLLTTYGNGTNFETFYHYTSSSNILLWYSIIGGTDYSRYWDPKLRDTEWYHAVLKYDSAQAAAADRVVLYLNGVEQTSYTEPAGTIPINHNSYINRNQSTDIGFYEASTGATRYGKGVKAQAAFVDGSSLDATSFGEFFTTGTNGQIWAPKSDGDVKTVVDAGGSNSFLISSAFGDGTDDSAKGNSFASGGGVMSDATNGSDDTPSNPLIIMSTVAKVGTTSRVVQSHDGGVIVGGTISGQYHSTNSSLPIPPTGKWYFECEQLSGAGVFAMGVWNTSETTISDPGVNPNSAVLLNNGSGTRVTRRNGVGTNSRTSDNNGDIFQVAFDADTGNIWLGRNDTWYGGGEPDTDTTPTYTLDIGSPNVYAFHMTGDSNKRLQLMRESEWTYTAPTDYKELRWSNLPGPPTVQGADLFNAVTYTGDGVAIGSGGQPITGAGFQPDLVVVKKRSAVGDFHHVDSSRGATLNLEWDNTNVEGTDSEGVTGFDADGFTVGSDTDYNQNTATFASWCWKLAGGTETTNNAGSVTTTVQSNEFMSLIRWQSPNNTGVAYTVGHGLTSPDLLIVRPRDAASSWYINGKTSTLPTFAGDSGYYVVLDLSGARGTDGISSGIFTASTHSGATNTFEFGTNTSIMQGDDQMLALAFKNVPGLCCIGEYTGNGSSDGTFVHTGFRPRFIMLKGAIANTEWHLFDTARGEFNENSKYLEADTTASEGSTKGIDMLANGFKLRTTSSDNNNSGTKYMFIAIADVASGAGLPPIPGR